MTEMEYCTEEEPTVQSMDCSESGQEEDDYDKSIAKGGVTTPFPWKLHDMLDAMALEGSHSVVTWQPHGRAFMVHKPKDFVEKIMPKYFNQTKYASFQRQLNLYGFSRLSHGKDKGAYYHMCFVRGQRNLCRNMVRQKIKGTKVRRSLSPEEEPNFYLPQWKTVTSVPMSPAQNKTTKTLALSSAASPLSKPASPPHTKALVAPKIITQVAPTESLVSMMRDTNKQAVPPAPALYPPPPIVKQLQPTPTEPPTHHGTVRKRW
eukprot:CAMPEP_0170343570 /NCGR_PEP_ID=MMETSP0116_2-20130129/72961_1 /TAXON_ID=400756 /ORGANISM="Durinskia baltica, Strain CSIRO CS-38" /LENGTH=261 /DNA_ID=CAMNT_0010597225 /DNA_START=156 /DNA_END=938 /DNA_ORIENTATION=-